MPSSWQTRQDLNLARLPWAGRNLGTSRATGAGQWNDGQRRTVPRSELTIPAIASFLDSIINAITDVELGELAAAIILSMAVNLAPVDLTGRPREA